MRPLLIITLALLCSGCTLLSAGRKAMTSIPRPVWDAAVKQDPTLDKWTSLLYPASATDPFSQIAATLDPYFDATGRQIVWPISQLQTKQALATIPAPGAAPVITAVTGPRPIVNTNPPPATLLRGPLTGAVLP